MAREIERRASNTVGLERKDSRSDLRRRDSVRRGSVRKDSILNSYQQVLFYLYRFCLQSEESAKVQTKIKGPVTI